MIVGLINLVNDAEAEKDAENNFLVCEVKAIAKRMQCVGVEKSQEMLEFLQLLLNAMKRGEGER